ncbi:tesmin isoform X4 [Gallus gallus]|uniref:tesmin isoform X4 n=1 Tax=Gallus gallus TaxID=9031 RepID=UPI001AE2A556|nr:tesmin isoform X4 [Gallus gallus]XP_040529143.1 tesmin isoform X4 [Gallus gallus]
MENQILFDIRSAIDDGFVTEILSQNIPDSSDNFSLETAVINNPVEGLSSSQGNQLYSIDVGEALLDCFEYPLSTENQNTTAKVETYPHGSNSCDNEDLEKYKGLNLPEEADYRHSPYLPSDGGRFLSSVVTQHKNCGVPTPSVFSSEGAASQNIGTVPVFRSLIPPTEDENNCIYYDQFKGIQNSPMQSKNLPDCFTECSSGVYGLPQTSASVYDEIAEVRDAIRNVTESHEDGAIFQSSNTDESNCELLALHGVAEEPGYLHRNNSSPLMICQLEGGTQILCIKNCGTQDLKTIHLIPQYEDQYADNPVTALLGQFLPVPGNLDSNKQEFEHEYLQSIASSSTFQPESNLHVKMTSAGLPFGSGITKSKKPCKCTKSQCLKLYCECFASGDFCNNCNCNNCYNNPLHETERFKAIKVCLDRNPEAFLPKIGQSELGDIKPHHNKGCNCKRSGCLKNYCECFEAKIVCSSICKCIGCKNYEESPDKKTQPTMLNYMDIGNNDENNLFLTSTFEISPKLEKDRETAVSISWEDVKSTCACLLVKAEEAEKGGYSVCQAERIIMEEFGRCLSQILHVLSKYK